jgi:hypothetical protein
MLASREEPFDKVGVPFKVPEASPEEHVRAPVRMLVDDPEVTIGVTVGEPTGA